MATTKKNTKTAAFGKAQLLSAIATSSLLAPEPVEIEELDAVIYVKRMTIGERDDYFAKVNGISLESGTSQVNAMAFSLAVVDEKGAYLFADEDGNHLATDDDIAELKKLPQVLTNAVLSKFNIINHFVVADATKQQAAEDGELKNS